MEDSNIYREKARYFYDLKVMKARYFAIYKKSKKYDRAFHSPHKKKQAIIKKQNTNNNNNKNK